MARRAAGVLLHPTSLPDHPRGLPGAAGELLAWMERAGLTVWQVLPLGPAGAGGSPYSSSSAFAGDPAWFPGVDLASVDEFASANASWLDDWCLFAALRERAPGRTWLDWDEPLRLRAPQALARAASELDADVRRHRVAQHRFHAGWTAIREEAGRRGIAILGDVPIYVALDAADVWAHQDLFLLEPDGRPSKVSGVPPDYFSETGQLWGNPLYRWDRAAAAGYAWWIDRLRRQLALHDALRLDHFRGFAGYWAVPAEAETAVHGSWEPGPGRALFEAVRASLGGLPFVAEDLGVITHDVVELRRALGLAGMRVLQFGLTDPSSDHAPHRLERDVAVYSGTHDNDTTRGWFEALDANARARVLTYLGGRESDAAWSVVRAAFTSIADLAIVPMQDLLDQGSASRMNVPGRAAGNWGWRLSAGALDDALAERVRALAVASGRAC